MKYHFKIHKEGKGYWAQCIELEGCITQADSRKELKKRMQEALNLYIDEPVDSKDLAALPDEYYFFVSYCCGNISRSINRFCFYG